MERVSGGESVIGLIYLVAIWLTMLGIAILVWQKTRLFYRNIKSGEVYELLWLVEDATNVRDGNWIVIYRHHKSRKKYARDLNEFAKKFEEVKK